MEIVSMVARDFRKEEVIIEGELEKVYISCVSSLMCMGVRCGH